MYPDSVLLDVGLLRCCWAHKVHPNVKPYMVQYRPEPFIRWSNCVPYIGDSVPYRGDRVPYIGDSVPYIGDSVPYKTQTKCLSCSAAYCHFSLKLDQII